MKQNMLDFFLTLQNETAIQKTFFIVSAIFILFLLFIAFHGIYGEIVFRRSFSKLLLRAKKNKKKKRGKFYTRSLRAKLTFAATVIVFCIVAFVVFPFGISTMKKQEIHRSELLYKRAKEFVLNISKIASAYMNVGSESGLAYLPNEDAIISEASYITIVGNFGDETKNFLTVLGTNDPDIAEKIDTKILAYGKSKYIKKEIAEIAKSYESEKKIDALEKNAICEIPSYDFHNLNLAIDEYIFYAPIFVHADKKIGGIVFVKIETKNLIAESRDIRRQTIFTLIMVALIAILISSLGAFITATFITSPLVKLSELVQVISDTKDKTKLIGKSIKIRHHDEIADLAESVNKMIASLSKSAEDEKLLIDGKSVQEAFLPLLVTENGKRGNVFRLHEKNFSSFAWYEAAQDVSGDYFDCKKLNDNYFLFIKSDAAGHGVPAGLMMTIIATLFNEYAANWNGDFDVAHFIEKANDFTSSLSLYGKFATLIIVLLNSQTGELFISNAGDNALRIYDANEKLTKIISLNASPAIGFIPTNEITIGFKTENFKMKNGDVIFLQTDGTEESKRTIRKTDENAKSNKSEIFGNERMQNIVQAVLQKKRYTLMRIAEEPIDFDFSNCRGNTEEIILALVSIEKMFRLHKENVLDEEIFVRVSPVIDSFLKKHCEKYGTYFSLPKKNESSFKEFFLLSEDAQKDDATLLALQWFGN